MPLQEREQIVLLKLWKISAKPNGLATAKNVRRYLATAVVNSLRDEFRAREGRYRNRPREIPLSAFDERAGDALDADVDGGSGLSRSLEIADPADRRRTAREDLERAIPRIMRLDGRFRISRRLRGLRGQPG